MSQVNPAVFPDISTGYAVARWRRQITVRVSGAHGSGGL
jgi:hypothetical protein